MLIKNIYTLWGRKMASDPDQEYMYFMGSETRTITCYIISEETSIPFTLRVTGIKIVLKFFIKFI